MTLAHVTKLHLGNRLLEVTVGGRSHFLSPSAPFTFSFPFLPVLAFPSHFFSFPISAFHFPPPKKIELGGLGNSCWQFWVGRCCICCVPYFCLQAPVGWKQGRRPTGVLGRQHSTAVFRYRVARPRKTRATGHVTLPICDQSHKSQSSVLMSVRCSVCIQYFVHLTFHSTSVCLHTIFIYYKVQRKCLCTVKCLSALVRTTRDS